MTFSVAFNQRYEGGAFEKEADAFNVLYERLPTCFSVMDDDNVTAKKWVRKLAYVSRNGRQVVEVKYVLDNYDAGGKPH